MSEQKTHQIHPYAKLFPALDDDDLMQLADDIREHGLQNPIWLDDEGLILDGRNRSAACLIAGVQPRYQTFTGSDEEKLQFVCSQNVHRRHLDTSQRAMIAATMLESFEALAQARMTAGKNPVANLPQGQPGKSRDQAGAALNVSGRTVELAKKVIAKAAPEVVEAVQKGNLAVSRAATIADLPKEQQVAALEAAPTTRAKRDRVDMWLCIVPGGMPLEVSEVAVNKSDPSEPITGWFVFESAEAATDEGQKHYDEEDIRAMTAADFCKGEVVL